MEVEQRRRIGIFGGTGWLGLALGRNLLKRGLPPADLAVANRRGPTGDYVAWPGVRWASSLADLVANSDVIVLSVRPEDYSPTGPSRFGGLVVSFMAGVSLARLSRDWPGARVLRAMPGGGATDGTAHVPWCSAGPLSSADEALAVHVLSAIGMVDKVADEAALAYLSALSGSGAAYPALMAQAMYANALGHGIAPDVAWRAVRSVVCDSPKLFASGPEAVENLIAVYLGYRGVTATGMNTAVAAGLPASVASALDAATEKALTFGS